MHNWNNSPTATLTGLIRRKTLTEAETGQAREYFAGLTVQQLLAARDQFAGSLVLVNLINDEMAERLQ